MILEAEDIKEIIQSPKDLKIQEGLNQLYRVQMHTDASLNRDSQTLAYHNWLRHISDVSDGDDKKFEFFQQLVKFPLVSTALTSNIYRQYKRIFHGADSRRDFEFQNPDLDNEFKAYAHTKKEWFETEGFKAFKTNPNCFLWVTIPDEESEQPKPYLKTLGLEFLVSASIEQSGAVNWAIFQMGEQFLVFDAEKVALTDDKGGIITDQVNYHGLGEAPIRQFWSTNLGKCKYVKDTPVASVLGDLDYLLSADVGKENVDLYAKFPFISLVEDEETYEDFKQGYIERLRTTGSEGADITYEDLEYRSKQAWDVRTQNKKFRNVVGRVFKRTPAKEGEIDITNAFEIVNPDTTALEHLVNDIDQRAQKITLKMTGHDGSGATAEAVNEKQIASEIDSKQDVLNEIKRNFELIETWAYGIMGAYMFGEKPLVSVNYGTRFFLKTANQVEDEFRQAKESGVSEGYLLSLLEEVVMTKYQNNPVERDKQLALLHLDPLPTYTVLEAYKMGVPETEILKKRSLNSYVNEWEARTGNRIGALDKSELLNVKSEFDGRFATNNGGETDPETERQEETANTGNISV